MDSLKTLIDKKKINKEVNQLSKGRYYCYKVIALLSILFSIYLLIVFVLDWKSIETQLYCIIPLSIILLFNGVVFYDKYKAINMLYKKVINMYQRGKGFYVEK